MMCALFLAAAALALGAPPAAAGHGPGEVTAVSILPGPGHAQVVIDITGSVGVQDFALANPTRLVIDVTGATLETGLVLYDGKNRGGILNIRYAQFRPDVVRVVLELESLKDYRIERSEDAIRISFGTDRSFAAWSSLDPATMTAALGSPYAADAPEPAPPARPLKFAPGRVADAQQSQQPRITVTYDSAQITDVIANIAAFSGRTIVVGRGVTGRFTGFINNQPWDIALQAILESQGLTAVEEGSGIIRVDSREVLAARDTLEPLRTKLVRVNYARASALVPALQAIISARGKVVPDTGTNTLIITDVESRIDQDSAFVAALDIQTPQVSIQAKLIFVNRTDIEQLGVRYDLGTSDQFFNQLVQRPDPASAQPIDTDGDGVPDQLRATEFFEQDQNIIDLGGNALSALANAEAPLPSPALQLIFSTAIGNFNLTSFVEALQRVELADLQAVPTITAADNTVARIQVGERTPIRQIDVSAPAAGGQNVPRATTTFEDTGIILAVTPHVTSTRQVLMQIHAENSSIRAAPADVGFTFQTQQADNQILVSDGETAVIGGLTVTEVTVAKSGIPFLVDLPIIGRIFGFTSRTENRRDLLILVTPHIIDDASGAATGGR